MTLARTPPPAAPATGPPTWPPSAPPSPRPSRMPATCTSPKDAATTPHLPRPSASTASIKDRHGDSRNTPEPCPAGADAKLGRLVRLAPLHRGDRTGRALGEANRADPVGPAGLERMTWPPSPDAGVIRAITGSSAPLGADEVTLGKRLILGRDVIALGQISHLRSARTATGRVLQMEREFALHLRQVGRAAKPAVQVSASAVGRLGDSRPGTATTHQLLRMPLAPR